MNSNNSHIPTSCSDPEVFEALVDDYALGILAPEDEERVLKHLDECALCHEEARRSAEFYLLCRYALAPEPTPEQVERVKAGVFRRIRRRERVHKLVWACGLAAGIALVAWSATLMTQPGPESPVVVDHAASAPEKLEKPEPGPAGPLVVQAPTEPIHAEVKPEEETPAAEPDPYAKLKPRAAYGRIWQKTTPMLRSHAKLGPEQRDLLAEHASYLESLLAKNSLAPAAWNHLRKIYERLGDLGAANRAFDRHVDVLEEQGKEAAVVQALVERGNRLLKKGASLEAVKQYSRVVNDHPNAPGSERAWYGIGDYYLSVGDAAQARKYFQHVCDNYDFREGVVRDAHYTLANVISNSGNYGQATEMMQGVLEKSSYEATQAYAQLRIGDFYRYQGKSAKAVQAYRRVLTKYQVESARKGAEYQLARLQDAVLGGALP